jgi:hypothetical protein
VLPILALTLAFFFMLALAVREQSIMIIEEKEIMLKDTETFLNILRSPVGDNNIADLIIMKYEGNPAPGLEGELTRIINLVYKDDKDLCWRLYVYPSDERELLAYTDCSKIEDLPIIDAKINLPLITEKGSILVRLVVPGYA